MIRSRSCFDLDRRVQARISGTAAPRNGWRTGTRISRIRFRRFCSCPWVGLFACSAHTGPEWRHCPPPSLWAMLEGLPPVSQYDASPRPRRVSGISCAIPYCSEPYLPLSLACGHFVATTMPVAESATMEVPGGGCHGVERHELTNTWTRDGP